MADTFGPIEELSIVLTPSNPLFRPPRTRWQSRQSYLQRYPTYFTRLLYLVQYRSRRQDRWCTWRATDSLGRANRMLAECQVPEDQDVIAFRIVRRYVDTRDVVTDYGNFEG